MTIEERVRDIEARRARVGLHRVSQSCDTLERRADVEDARLVGYAAKFGVRSENLGGFVEIVEKGAFSRTLQERSRIYALIEHTPGRTLGVTEEKTLALREDDDGLAVEIQPDMESPDVRSLVRRVERREVRGMSFGFRTVRDSFKTDGDITVRRILEVELFEVSAVTFPAYPQTEIGLRSLFSQAGSAHDFPPDARALVSRLRTLGLTDPELRDMFASAVELLPPEPEQRPGARNEMLRRRLQLAELESVPAA